MGHGLPQLNNLDSTDFLVNLWHQQEQEKRQKMLDAQNNQLFALRLKQALDEDLRQSQSDKQTVFMEQHPELAGGGGPTLDQMNAAQSAVAAPIGQVERAPIPTSLESPLGPYQPQPTMAEQAPEQLGGTGRDFKQEYIAKEPAVTGIPSSVPGGPNLPAYKPVPRWIQEAQAKFEQDKALELARKNTLATKPLGPGERLSEIAGTNIGAVEGPAKVPELNAEDQMLFDDLKNELGRKPSGAEFEAYKLELKGETGAAADAKFRKYWTKKYIAQGMSQEEAEQKAYEKQKLMVPSTVANIRLEGYQKSRMYQVYDHKLKMATYVSAEDLNNAKATDPGRYTVASFTPEAIGMKKITEYMISGKGGQQITAYNTALTHLDTLERLAIALDNSDYYLVNKVSQEWQKQTGKPAPMSFDAAKNAMSGEVGAALKASGVTDQEIEKVASTFDRAYSEKGILAAIGTYRELLASKSEQLKKQYEAGMQGKPSFQDKQSQNPPKVGDIQDGYVFMGGDPADPKNWRK